MTEAVTANPGRRLAARYTLHERLGAGGQGEVWRAHDSERGFDIALKILQPPAGRSATAWAALLHEHESASHLDHPGILKVYAPARDGAELALPMELAAGGDLRRLRGAGYLAVVPVLMEIAQALEYAHERGVVHRDLKPGNVLFDARGRVKLADFGAAARLTDPAGGAAPRTLSPFSASPQQLRGEPPAPSDDVYGLGALAYELLSRYPPHYPNFDPRSIQTDPVPPLVPAQPIPPQLDRLIQRMLAKEARERPASMREIIDELDAALNDTLTFEFETAEPPREAAPVDRRAPHTEPAAPAPAAAAGGSTVPLPPGVVDGPSLWEELRHSGVTAGPRFEPIRSGIPWVFLGLVTLAAVALGAFLWLPRFASLLSTTPRAIVNGEPTAGSPSGAAPALEAQRADFERRLGLLEKRGAGVWGGADFAAAKTRAAESVGAYDAGSIVLAQQRLTQAGRLLDAVERAAPAALAAQLAAGERALAAGQQELAAQAFDLAVRIDPQDRRATLGQSRSRQLSGILPLLADAENAFSARQYARAAQDYSEALRLDPTDADARVGLSRANAALGDDSYARAAGEGFAALGAGRLEEAGTAFLRAQSLRPNAAEAAEGLRRVKAAEGGRAFAAQRARGAALEAQERWDEALKLYDSVLRQDRSLAFAQQGRARAADRLRLHDALEALIERPARLASPDVRSAAIKLLQSARGQASPGPVLRGQMERVSALMPEFDKPVPVSLVSDGVTEVAIPSVGHFGAFARRDIELKPGHYTVIGTRNGYRDVRRDLVVSPGQPTQTLTVRASEPI